jgi:hypothetical protein
MENVVVLPAPFRTEEADDLAARDLERHAVDDGAARRRLHQPLRRDTGGEKRRLRRRHRSCRVG